QADGIFKLVTNKHTHYSKSVIITAGNGAYQPHSLELAGSAKHEKKNLHYFVEDVNKYAGKSVVVFGRGDSAVEWTMMLEPIAAKVTIVHRRD
ncbi:NAD(P)/FAD-dependent oxidoreductase, partial [Bacillus thuringiensis]|uniref:NAD(P)/FAD-dependent oxidoreductase n=1 Tax=Bacillus thuringiensis TaxID=1428 RepID=UPI0028469749